MACSFDNRYKSAVESFERAVALGPGLVAVAAPAYAGLGDALSMLNEDPVERAHYHPPLFFLLIKTLMSCYVFPCFSASQLPAAHDLRTDVTNFP